MDVDTGVDDALAIILALSQGEKLDLLGITTVAGNLPLERTTYNTRAVLALCGRSEVPVSPGAEKPLFVPLHTAIDVHGAVGLGNVELPPPPEPEEPPEHAVDFLRRRITESEQPVTLVPTGPLTNIALLFLTCPEIKKKIRKIVLMGGSAFTGNQTAVAEFNIFVDPEAARIVFDSGLPIVMTGLDVTHKSLLYKNEIEEIGRIGTEAALFCEKVLSYYMGVYQNTYGPDTGCAIHDAAAVAYMIAPKIFSGKKAHVTVDLDGSLTRGCTVCDFRDSVYDEDKNAYVLMDVERPRFVTLLTDAIRTASSEPSARAAKGAQK